MRAVQQPAAVSKTARFHVTRRKIENPEIPKSKIQKWCSREDSNLHGFPHTVLSRTRLPIPPREQEELIKLRERLSCARRNHACRSYIRRLLRARASSCCALRALPNERSKSA